MLSKRLRRTVSFAPLLTASLVAALAIGPQPAAAESGGHARQAYEKHTRAGHGYVGRAYRGRPYVGRARGRLAAQRCLMARNTDSSAMSPRMRSSAPDIPSCRAWAFSGPPATCRRARAPTRTAISGNGRGFSFSDDRHCA
jgi:hypothetical protein